MLLQLIFLLWLWYITTLEKTQSQHQYNFTTTTCDAEIRKAPDSKCRGFLSTLMTSQMSRRSSPFVTSFPDHSRTYKNVSSYSLPKISYSSRISVTTFSDTPNFIGENLFFSPHLRQKLKPPEIGLVTGLLWLAGGTNLGFLTRGKPRSGLFFCGIAS